MLGGVRQPFGNLNWRTSVAIAIVLAAILAAVFAPLVTVLWSVRPKIPNEGWIAIGTAAYVFLLSIAAFFALRQLREDTKARLLQGINQIYADVHAPKSKEARKYVRQNDPSALASPSADRDKLERAADSFEHVGLLAYHHLVPRELILDYFWEAILETWHGLERWICTERCNRGRQYADHFEYIAGEAEKYRQQKYPDYRIGTRPAAASDPMIRTSPWLVATGAVLLAVAGGLWYARRRWLR